MMTSTHNKVLTVASLVASAAIQPDATAAHSSRQLGHGQALSWPGPTTAAGRATPADQQLTGGFRLPQRRTRTELNTLALPWLRGPAGWPLSGRRSTTCDRQVAGWDQVVRIPGGWSFRTHSPSGAAAAPEGVLPARTPPVGPFSYAGRAGVHASTPPLEPNPVAATGCPQPAGRAWRRRAMGRRS